MNHIVLFQTLYSVCIIPFVQIGRNRLFLLESENSKMIFILLTLSLFFFKWFYMNVFVLSCLPISLLEDSQQGQIHHKDKYITWFCQHYNIPWSLKNVYTTSGTSHLWAYKVGNTPICKKSFKYYTLLSKSNHKFKSICQNVQHTQPATSLPSAGLSRCAMCCLTPCWSLGKQWAVHTSFYIRRDWQKAAHYLLTHRLLLQLPATHYLYHPTHCTPLKHRRKNFWNIYPS